MERALNQWLVGVTVRPNAGKQPSSKILQLPYVIYGHMLLLRPNAFQTPGWRALHEHATHEEFQNLYRLLAEHLKVTHIAISKAIPALEANGNHENIIRAPIDFTPLYGDFGPSVCGSPPIYEDFDAAFWVTAKQNGIYQTWAPRWTMFSRGNISEKARLLSLDSVEQAVDEGRASGKGCCAVDLYAGIGYFAFSYLKAGFDQVLCWDLSPWSIEGLRRGAAANKWSCRVLTDRGHFESCEAHDAKMLIFNESNEAAIDRISVLKTKLPPIRHVNCGLLPTSRGSWRIALDILDSDLDGWVHVHENFAVNEVDLKAEEVREAFQAMLRQAGMNGVVAIDCLSRLKSYAPGVIHCVVDLRIARPVSE